MDEVCRDDRPHYYLMNAIFQIDMILIYNQSEGFR